MIHQELRGMPCTYGISAATRGEVGVSRMLSFDPESDGEELWKKLEDTGKLDDIVEAESSKTSNDRFFLNF